MLIYKHIFCFLSGKCPFNSGNLPNGVAKIVNKALHTASTYPQDHKISGKKFGKMQNKKSKFSLSHTFSPPSPSPPPYSHDIFIHYVFLFCKNIVYICWLDFLGRNPSLNMLIKEYAYKKQNLYLLSLKDD